LAVRIFFVCEEVDVFVFFFVSYGDTFWLLNDIPCLTAGVTCFAIDEENEGPPGDILNSAPTTCFAKGIFPIFFTSKFPSVKQLSFCLFVQTELVVNLSFCFETHYNSVTY
jgi:hypothetical protein